MLDNATERLEALRKKYYTAQTTMRLLAQAKEKLTTAYAPKLRENFLSLVSQATDGAFSDAIVSADFRTELTADGATREMGYFSKTVLCQSCKDGREKCGNRKRFFTVCVE